MHREPTAAVVLTLTLATALSASCSRRAPSPAPTAAVPPAASVAPPNAPPTKPTAGTLAERLAAEAGGRPSAGLHAEDVAAALRGAGVTVGPLTQVLGRTIGARYCATTTTAAGVAVAVCEFADPAEAERGLDYSHRTFDRLVPGRTLVRNRGIVLTLTPGETGAAPAADASRAAAVFAAL